MCPACIATAAWIAAGTTSAGAFFGIVLKNLPRRGRRKPARAYEPAPHDPDRASHSRAKTTELRCLCGAIQIQLSGKPTEQFYCHCDDCQATHGAAYTGVAVYPAAAVKVSEGQPATWTLTRLPRSRCAGCGTHLFAQVPSLGVCAVSANLLPVGEFRPQFHQQCRYAVLPVQDDLPHFASFPPQFGGTDERVEW